MSRPKKRSLSPGSKRASPRYGARSPAEDARTSASASRQRRSHSSGSASSTWTYARSNASEGNWSPAAVWDSAVVE
ncbi:hypothetical protein G3I77_09085 [Streptomyces sp. D2-8]|uniref:hypothetical protein n=1 Tax=Streptomyces sp. D2-8 TaxID=2707767 RepID=UPI0027E51A0A|nr:hypothetical protein [Streptomyces sp. D2-8]MCK8433190.1 hypothetical protein [Streptomyces sp. D2-8]